jgi:hypothetical protein
MRLKLILLLVALGFNYTITARWRAAVDRHLSVAASAVMSLALWISVVFSGIFYAFT